MFDFTPSCLWSFKTINNSNAGNYTIYVHAYDSTIPESLHNFYSFNLELLANEGPVKNVSMYDYSSISGIVKTKSLYTYLFYDPEGEPMTYSYTVSPPASFITINTSSLINMILSDASTNADINNYTVTISATDGHSDTTVATNIFYVVIEENLPSNYQCNTH